MFLLCFVSWLLFIATHFRVISPLRQIRQHGNQRNSYFYHICTLLPNLHTCANNLMYVSGRCHLNMHHASRCAYISTWGAGCVTYNLHVYIAYIELGDLPSRTRFLYKYIHTPYITTSYPIITTFWAEVDHMDVCHGQILRIIMTCNFSAIKVQKSNSVDCMLLFFWYECPLQRKW